MWGCLSLARPLNCVMSAVGVGIAAVATVGLAGVAARALSIGIAGLVAALFIAAGNALNDYYARDTDRVNHPDRPIPRGEVSPNHARSFAAVLFAVSFVGALAVNVEASLVVTANLAAMIFYEKFFKSRGGSGNALIAYLVGSLFVFGGFSAYGGDLQALSRSVVLGLLAGFATTGREIAKDIEDVAGDVDRRAPPERMGRGAARGRG